MKRTLTFLALMLCVGVLAPSTGSAFELFGNPYLDSQIPVPVSANQEMAPQCPRDFNPYIRAGTTWNQVSCSKFWFKKNGLRNRDAFRCDGVDHIAMAPLDPGILGITSINCFSNFRETGIFFNSDIPWKCSGTPNRNQIDLETVALHEFGHMLGLGHSDDSSSIMAPVYSGVQRTLAQDDRDGICFLYPKGGDTVGGELFPELDHTPVEAEQHEAEQERAEATRR